MIVETGITFVTANGGKWMKHTVGLDFDYVEAHLDGEALERYGNLDLMEKILAVRAVTELSVSRYRETQGDPDWSPNQYGAWLKVLKQLLGDKGIGRLGV